MGTERRVSEAPVYCTNLSLPSLLSVITQSETQVPRWPGLFSFESPPPPPQAELMTHFAPGLQQQHPAGCTHS